MKNYTKVLLLLVFTSLTLFSCKKDRFNGGSIITEDREVDMSLRKLYWMQASMLS